MNQSSEKIKGYVYILEVKDIDLPVCKIGMTSRNPFDRCKEINNSSTGDFIWEVAYQVGVDDCKKLESIVHKKLQPLKQRRREFFNINAEDAFKALLSIMNSRTDIKEISIDEARNLHEEVPKKAKRKRVHKSSFRAIDSQYTEVLQSFTSIIGIKGRPFGQLNKPQFGISDGNEGVQWNIAVWPDVGSVQLGVNLEGMKYRNWPIANFILSELNNPSIAQLQRVLKHPEQIYVRFTRDAWQVTARPSIVEKYFGVDEVALSELRPELWDSMLKEALGCLDEKKNYRGRSSQSVTLVNKPKNGEQMRTMDVSPHLTIWTPIDMSGDLTLNVERRIQEMEPVYEWITRVSK
jgi:hypothetical protein